MSIKQTIEAIVLKHQETGITLNPPASLTEITLFEQITSFSLPADFKEFYSICDGFSCEEDLFNMTSLIDIYSYHDYKANSFDFAEYMTICDSWGLRITSNGVYEIFNASYPTIPLTSSLEEFLNRFLTGNVFDTGGLYDWGKELNIEQSLHTQE